MRGGARPGAGRPRGVKDSLPRRTARSVRREYVADFFKDLENYNAETTWPELKRMFAESHDQRLRADLGRLFLSYQHGSPTQRLSVSEEKRTVETEMIAALTGISMELPAGPDEPIPKTRFEDDESTS
jgi:hypothetical protein